MLRWICVSVLLSACGIAAVWMLAPYLNSGTASAGAYVEPAEPKNADRPSADPAPPPDRAQSVIPGGRGQPEVYIYPNDNPQAGAEPILVPDATLTIVGKQEVASEKEGVVIAIATQTRMGEEVPKERQLDNVDLGLMVVLVGPKPIEGESCFKIGGDSKNWYRRARPKETLEANKVVLVDENLPIKRLKRGDWVNKGDLVAIINPLKAKDDVSVKLAKLNAVDVQREAAFQTKREYVRRRDNYIQVNRVAPGAIPTDTLAEILLQIVKYDSEGRVKKAEIIEASRTLNAAFTDLKMHEVRARIDGFIQDIYRNPQGDAVKPYEPILRIEDPRRLRVEGRLELQEALKLNRGMTAIVEATRPEAPKFVLNGHMAPVNCVAVGKDKNNRTVIVSGDDDGTLRGWDAATGAKLWWVYGMSSPVRSVACTPPGCKQNLACFGCANGSVRLVDLDNPRQPPQELSERHRGSVLSIAFSPKGDMIATCGDDRPPVIRMWNTQSHALMHMLSNHSGPITSVQFASATRLVSAGSDKRLVVWDVAEGKPPRALRRPRFDGRGGEVQTLGVSPDGNTVLFDQDKEIHLLTLADKQHIGFLQNSSSEMNFSTMALFSPDGKTILTNGPAPGKLQLWRTPVAPQRRGSELRQFIWNTPHGTATSGAFFPDGSHAVTGTQDHKVLVWAMPEQKEIDSRLEAQVQLVDKYLDTQSRHVRVWAELDNPGWLIPGMKATMVLQPPAK